MSVCKIAICDDIDIERDMLCMMLQSFGEEQIIHHFSCGEDLLASPVAFDLVFLDIYMNGMTGMEVAKVLKNNKSKALIVFLTSSPNFAVESYEVHAFDYIVKPLQPERLKTVWKRFLSLHRKRERFLLLNNSGKTEKIAYEQIEFLESDCHYVIIHMTDGTTVRILGKLDDFEQRIDDADFLRCHKSFLINMRFTESMDGDFIMRSGTHVSYRKREKKHLQKIFNDYALKLAYIS